MAAKPSQRAASAVRTDTLLMPHGSHALLDVSATNCASSFTLEHTQNALNEPHQRCAPVFRPPLPHGSHALLDVRHRRVRQLGAGHEPARLQDARNLG